jgi:hypothetical protein
MNDVVGVDAEPNLNRNDQSFPEVVEMSRNPTVNSI